MFVEADDLRRALQRDEIEPYFQPMVSLRSGELAGFEMLARLRHPRLGIVLPDSFIPVAETHGLINALTGNLLTRAFSIMDELPKHLYLSVNISPRQLRGRLLPLEIRNLAEAFHFPLSRLVIEITESALLENLDHANSIALELKQMGCRLSLDDFGTGYSSLLHLQSLPFDELKIDRSFVSSMLQKRQSRKIVSAVIGLGQNLGLTTIAEGVNAAEQSGLLLSLGCDIGQGWLFGKPVPGDDLPRVIAEKPSPILANPALNLPEEIFISTLPSQRLAQLEALYEGAPVGLALLNRDLRYVTLNRRHAALHGLPIESFFGRRVSELFPILYPQLEPYLLRALSGEAVAGIEIVKPDGDIDPEMALLVSYLPVYDESREVNGVAVSAMDITERRRAEAALRESEDHYRHMVELNPQIPWVCDAEFRALTISPRWRELTGTTDEENLGRGFIRPMHPEDQPRVIADLEHARATGEKLDTLFRARTRFGEWRWFRSRGSPRRNEQGKILGWYGGVDDIDDLKRTEEALRRSESELRSLTETLALQLAQSAQASLPPRSRPTDC